MERTEKIGLAVAVVGHGAIFALLTVGFLSKPAPEAPKPKAIDISLVDKVALEATAPPAAEPPAQSRAPEPAPPADAAPPEAAPEPRPEPPAPSKPPAPVPAPAPKPAAKAPPPPKKLPVTKPETPPKPKAPPVKAPPVKASAAPTKQAATAKGTGTNAAAKKPRVGGFVLDQDTLKGLSATPTKAKAPSPAAPGAAMDAAAAADIASAIKRQVQPCAFQQKVSGPGVSRIVVTIRLQLNKDGSLNGRPTIPGPPTGVDDENSRYVDAVERSAIAAFVGCAPLRGLPIELYDVPRGWKTFNLRFKLPD